MADPVAIAAAISGLLPLVRENFALIVDAFVSSREWRFCLGRAELEQTIFQSWDQSWTESDATLDQAFSKFAAKSPLTARGLLQQLVLLLRTLSDPTKVQREFGLTFRNGHLHTGVDIARETKYACAFLDGIDARFSTRDLDVFEENRRRHMSFLKQVHFTVTGSQPNLDDLFVRLDEFNRTVQLTTPSELRQLADRKVLELMVRDAVKDADRTRRLEDAVAKLAKESIDQGAKEMYDDLSKLANFRMAIQAANPSDVPRKKIFAIEDFSFDTPYYLDNNTTLARLFDYPTKYQSRLVLVEWVSLTRGTSPAAVLETMDETKVTWYILHAEKPQRILLPATIGLILDHTSSRSIGFVYQLPHHIRGNLPTRPVASRDGQPGGARVVLSPKAIAAQRLPTSLRQLIQKKEPGGLDLGIRFKLAKKLLDAVHLMHAAGFTHRNIHPDNILLFPARFPDRNEPDPSNLDYDNPIIVGFHDARLEIEFTPSTDPVPWTQPTGLKPILKHPNRAKPVVIDCYRHPDQRLAPEAPFRRQHDLYGVGCVLLELGLWDTLDNLSGREIAARAPEVGGAGRVDKEGVWLDAEVVKKAARGLDVTMGSVYAEVTRRCLSVNPIKGDVLDFERQLASAMAEIWA
ncbi:hypothetical protein C8A05DRAFT_39915 [Staphylotrichum tortipilum]|uniref:Protein kinase domain-containing protein n=1 Tax=Staphylotrichum tortipilum TaxID=2831512 RepID=A0AAN6M814_9PEZI|nr:hypothetical protein C8A05DRAFT_39915 [Staphylotrichum longicolle]